MKKEKTTYTVGVIVGRYQLAELHEAHIELIKSIVDNHDKTIIFLGLSPAKGTINNPLDFQPRKQMLLEYFPAKEYPDLTIGYIKDQVDDVKWSDDLDNNIEKQISWKGTQGKIVSVTIWGGEETVIDKYKGHYTANKLQPSRYISTALLRKNIAESPKVNSDFRSGAIWATYQRYPTVFTTVDICVFKPKTNEILLAKKPNETLYRFVGGFADPNSISFEDDALRELDEETGLTVGLDGLHYICSQTIDDWRYRNEVDKIRTLFFLAIYSHGFAEANDDIEEIRWFQIKEVSEDIIVPEHRELFVKLLGYLRKFTNFAD